MPDAACALVVQTAFLGDVVLTTPLLETLARTHGPVDVVTTPAGPPGGHPSAAGRGAGGALLGEGGAGAAPPFVALAPGSIWGSKRWPYYKELAQRLSERAAIVTVGGPEDAALGEEIVQAVAGGRRRSRAVNTCGQLTLRQSAEVIRRAAA